MRKISFAGIELTSQRVRGYMVPLSYRGDRQVDYVYLDFRNDDITKELAMSVCCLLSDHWEGGGRTKGEDWAAFDL